VWGDINNGVVRARIIRHLESSGIEEDKPGDYISTNMIEEGFSSDTKLYLSTDKGLLEYDKATGNVNELYNFENDNCLNIYQTAGGELWLGNKPVVYSVETVPVPGCIIQHQGDCRITGYSTSSKPI